MPSNSSQRESAEKQEALVNEMRKKRKKQAVLSNNAIEVEVQSRLLFRKSEEKEASRVRTACKIYGEKGSQTSFGDTYEYIEDTT